jgi:hypothetical protein
MSEARPSVVPDLRLAALRRFAVAITVFNILGHFWFGFEQSWAQPLAALATAYTLELGFELLDARLKGRRPRFLGGPLALANFLLSAHISGLAVSMLLYANERIAPVMFGTAVAIGSKYVFRAPVGKGSRHFFNPSNLGITATLLAFPWVGIAAPYMFTENLSGAGDWILPGLFVLAGSFLNTVFTRRVPLIASWLGCFALQGVLRSLLAGTPTAVELLPMTGVAFILFTFYMVTDPATTPDSTRGQLCFGAAVAAAYGVLLALHVVFTLFFALTIVCAGRGMALALKARAAARAAAGAPVPAPRGAVERAGA